MPSFPKRAHTHHFSYQYIDVVYCGWCRPERIFSTRFIVYFTISLPVLAFTQTSVTAHTVAAYRNTPYCQLNFYRRADPNPVEVGDSNFRRLTLVNVSGSVEVASQVHPICWRNEWSPRQQIDLGFDMKRQYFRLFGLIVAACVQVNII